MPRPSFRQVVVVMPVWMANKLGCHETAVDYAAIEAVYGHFRVPLLPDEGKGRDEKRFTVFIEALPGGE